MAGMLTREAGAGQGGEAFGAWPDWRRIEPPPKGPTKVDDDISPSYEDEATFTVRSCLYIVLMRSQPNLALRCYDGYDSCGPSFSAKEARS